MSMPPERTRMSVESRESGRTWSQADQRDVDAVGELGRYLVEFVFGDIYSRPGLSVREREVITVAVLTALGGRDLQLGVHMKAALHLGVSAKELEEIVLKPYPTQDSPQLSTR